MGKFFARAAGRIGLVVLAASGFFTTAASAQDSAAKARYTAIAERFVAAYNRQDYAGMRAHFSGDLKEEFTEEVTRSFWGGQYRSLGPMVLRPGDVRVQGTRVAFPLRYTRDTTVRELVVLAVSSKDTITGWQYTEDPYHFTPPALLARTNAAAVDSILAEHFPQGFSGTVLFSSGRKVVFQKNYGSNDPEGRVPVNDSSVFELASCSKQFTAAAILRLQELGKLSVEDSLRKFFPELPYPGVRVRHLVHHTAGLPGYESVLADPKSCCKDYCYNADVMRWLASGDSKSGFAPGSRFEYSNTGYAVLAAIIEKASGVSYADFLREQFFVPLGMTHTRVYNTRRTAGEVIPNYAYGTVWDRGTGRFRLPDSTVQYRYVIRLDGITGDGTVNTTARDLVRWSQSLRGGGVLSPASLAAVRASGATAGGASTHYGYGVMLARRKGVGLVLAHTGGWPGYETLVYHFPEADKMLVILSNKEHDDNNLSGAARSIASLFIAR